jgi:hypothetical protein
MNRKIRIKSSPENCGCLINNLPDSDHLKDENQEKEENGNKKRLYGTPEGKEKRLCSTRESDLEFYVDPDAAAVSQDFYLRRMTDGLPIIPPTRERVNQFLKYTDYNPEDLLAVLPPRMGQATPEKMAINAVMAGCLPQFFPVVQGSIQALGQEKFNLTGVNATTHPVAVCTILNGPLSGELGLNSGAGCLGPGYQANATIGRAVRLILLNIAGAVPGVGDHATHGSPAKYSYCFAEAEAESPWEPLHVERGFSGDENTVTVLAAEAPHNVNDHRSQTAEDLLDTIIHTVATAGCNNSHVPGEILVIMGPEHVQTVFKDEWEKKDVKEYIHQNAVVPVELGNKGGRKLDEQWIVDGSVKITRSPADVVLVVAGGPGRHTLVAPGFGTSSESVTVPITFKK